MHLLTDDSRRGDARSGSEGRGEVLLLEDLKLARDAQKDRMAAETLVERLAPRVRQTVLMAVGGDQEADDLTHVCLVEILENLGHYRGAGPLEAWAGRLTYRVLMRHLSRRRRSERTVALTSEEHGIAVSNPEHDASQERLRSRLKHHLQKLPEERRVTLVLRLVYQYSVAEVAEITNAPVNTVRDRIRVGLKELRQSLLRDPQATDFLKEGRHD